MPNVEILLNALNDIAAWGQGEKVDGNFDEPWSANRARESLDMWNSDSPQIIAALAEIKRRCEELKR